MATAAKLAELDKEYADREERGEQVLGNDGSEQVSAPYAAPYEGALQARPEVQSRIRTRRMALHVPDTPTAAQATCSASNGPSDDGPQIWRAAKTPWLGPPLSDDDHDSTPIVLPPSFDPQVQLHVPTKGSPRGDVQA
eukprot:CAMPEP_0179489308 /NCGR_PEP_ID=MMETSP0799-20121207/64713_1 /TAXON_ID=46947 /ORGANISM="Geminigera cryophila, Strain CCMP2564" /LENGTH=137 /DNA_ID=CAMNT_0021305139 /DNA_START=24 /DNA_END=433 /DNA_ORIENTATION=+